MKRDKGFSLVELIIVIVIVGLLSIISVPIYRGHVQRSVAVEGRALVNEIAAAQEIHRARSQTWFVGSGVNAATTTVAELGLDSRRNRYFRLFQYTMTDENNFSVETTGETGTRAEGIQITLTWKSDSPATVIENIESND
ncbi:MAG: prepilin-type N-terminal cleavage/methylation domain-containing protein [Endomicrobium sp.]|jgi:prepilin-type N-terminal cleavage/methylation domain-containing protein|nr:prepilin-type N-terminal cleavage/methylation domain-containing protein [Endomicrobium sp.]